MTDDMLMQSVLGRKLDAEVRFADKKALDAEETELVTRHFGKPRQFRFDYADVGARVAWEIEGGVWIGGRHTSGSGYVKDMEKYNCAVMLGWRVIRSTPDTKDRVRALELVRELLLRDRPAGRPSCSS